MNAKQAAFVQEYLIDRNGAGAAVRAGYSQRTARQIAHKLLTKPDVAAAVAAGEAQIARGAAITRQKVLDGLQEAIELARARLDPSAMIRGWATLAKLCGYYSAERHEVRISAEGLALHRELEQLSDAELLALVAKAPPEVRRTAH